MSIKEQIRQEIERRKEICEGIFERESDTYYQGKAVAYGELLPFIDSLPEETSYDINKLTPTPSVNIEDVARVQFASHAKVFDKKRKAVFDWEQFKEVAGIFYGFGKRDSLPEEKPSEDLEGAAEEYLRNVQKIFLNTLQHPNAKACFIAGAEWQKKHDAELIEIAYNDGITIGKTKQNEQMMKDAVEGYVAQRVHGELYAKAKVPESMNLKFGDKVKIIIIKDND